MPDDVEIDEIVAKSVHETWMSARLAEGWVWGPLRDDAKKEHPCLVAYDDLPESERLYDYSTARAVVRALRQQGYVIAKPSETSRRQA